MNSDPWHYEQAAWHRKRITPWNLKGGSRWHRLQYKWHISKVTFTSIVAFTFRKHAKDLADNIMSNNAILKHLTR